MANALNSVPDFGAGHIKHLVHAFESLLSISDASSDADRAGEETWALPGLQPWKDESNFGVPSDFPDIEPSRRCTSPDGNSNRSSWDSRMSSSESLRSSWNRKLKVTSQHPFKLRPEQIGRAKEQQFIKEVQEMLIEDESAYILLKDFPGQLMNLRRMDLPMCAMNLILTSFHVTFDGKNHIIIPRSIV
ncbi:hypothetical protein BRADI_2g35510v3 [Brachypodium distachyon]|uniref:Uncharacterized protein n=1 Tax=Brachypodium distachyon TaxID=15368 RepID=I1HLQ1_BRADI|nr:hypothetical protein BRADI_2g35510v3 [Brachypodium distachyon]